MFVVGDVFVIDAIIKCGPVYNRLFSAFRAVESQLLITLSMPFNAKLYLIWFEESVTNKCLCPPNIWWKHFSEFLQLQLFLYSTNKRKQLIKIEKLPVKPIFPVVRAKKQTHHGLQLHKRT